MLQVGARVRIGFDGQEHVIQAVHSYGFEVDIDEGVIEGIEAKGRVLVLWHQIDRAIVLVAPPAF